MQLNERSSRFSVLHRNVFLVDDVKLFGHQRFQLAAILNEMIEHAGHGGLHIVKRLVPFAQGFLPHELPQPFNQVDIWRVRWNP